MTTRSEPETPRRRLGLEAGLVLAVAAVWAVLAAVYQFAPSLGMPGYARVWGGGAAVFLLLAVPLLRGRRDGAASR
jgi:hypothetical protein